MSAKNTPFEIRTSDTLVVLAVELYRLNASGVEAAADLTGDTVTFTMVNAATGTVVVNAASATVTDATNGLCHYDFQSADVTTAGVYWYTFRQVESTEKASFPVNPKQGVVWIHSDTQTAQEAYRAAIEAA